MIIPVDKEKTMNEFKIKYINGYFENEYPKMQEKFNKDKEYINKKIVSKFKEVCFLAKKMQEEHKKNDIKYIYISFLRTSIMQDCGIFRIDIYDNKWFLDKEECSVNIDLSFIYETLFKHVIALKETRKKYGRTITEMDIEKIKLKEADKYNTFIIQILKGMINDFIECNEYKDLKKSEEISILTGEYYDEVEILHKNSKEE